MVKKSIFFLLAIAMVFGGLILADTLGGGMITHKIASFFVPQEQVQPRPFGDLFTGSATTSQANSQLFNAARTGNAQQMRSALRNAPIDSADSSGMTSLMHAGRNKNINALSVLLESGADTDLQDSQGYTALMHSAASAFGDGVELLLNNGADPNIIASNKTALTITLENRRRVIAAEIIASGADVNQKGADGTTPLMYAAMSGDTENIKALVDRGARVNERDNIGNTAMSYAAEYGSIAAINELIAHGADIGVRNDQGQSLLELARRNGHAQTVEFLQSIGVPE